MASPDISVIITAHREGVIAGATARSALAALGAAGSAVLSYEVIVVLDRADAVTEQVLRHGLHGQAQFLETSEGDPGQARNRGIEVANGRCSTFLDADDLWSENWLVEAWKMIEARPDAVAHSACNIVFGRARRVWWHTDSEAALCDHAYLSWLNYWDAMTFGRTELYRRFPFRRNDLALKFGHEDWHWNMWTLSEGVAHKPVPGTIHFKRARPGSQMAKVEGVGAVPWPLALAGSDELKQARKAS